MQRRSVTSVPGRALARRTSSTSWPISHSPRPRRLATGAVRGTAGRPRSRMVTSIQPPRTLTVTVTGCASSDPYRMALVAASLTARTRSSTTSSGMAAGTSAKLCRMARRSDDGRRVVDHGPLPGSLGWSHAAPLRVRVDRRLAGPLPGLLCLAGRLAQLRQSAEALPLLAEGGVVAFELGDPALQVASCRPQLATLGAPGARGAPG